MGKAFKSLTDKAGFMDRVFHIPVPSEPYRPNVEIGGPIGPFHLGSNDNIPNVSPRVYDGTQSDVVLAVPANDATRSFAAVLTVP